MPVSHVSEIITVGFLGNFLCDPPLGIAYHALYSFVEFLQEQSLLAKEKKLIGACQGFNNTTDTRSRQNPGAAFMVQLQTWKIFVSITVTMF